MKEKDLGLFTTNVTCLKIKTDYEIPNRENFKWQIIFRINDKI